MKAGATCGKIKTSLIIGGCRRMSTINDPIVLIPAYKPSHELLVLVDKLIRGHQFKVVIVNDGSGTEYDAVFSALPQEVDLLVHPINRGKGEALKTGFDHVQKNYPSSVGVITADADGQHIPKDIQRTADALKEHPDTIILGARHFEGKVPLRSRFGNSMTRFVFALASHRRVHDVQTGLRAIPTKYLGDMLELEGSRYEYEMNMLFWMAQKGVPSLDIRITTIYIDNNSSSHFNPIKDSIKIYSSIFKFMGSSLLAFGVDYVILLVLNGILKPYMAPSLALLISTVVARIVSSLVNFFVNKRLVFKDTGNLAQTAFKFYTLVVIVLCLNYGLNWALNIVLGVWLWVSQIITQTSLFVLNYFLQKKFIFKDQHSA